MAHQVFHLDFDGYWRKAALGRMPASSGIYCVYTCVYNKNKKTVSLKRLIYIGEADDVQDRIKNHEKWPKWKNYLKEGQVLCFSFASIESTNRQRAEAAMIFHHKPPVNVEYKNSFPFDSTTIHTSGKSKFLTPEFTVHRT